MTAKSKAHSILIVDDDDYVLKSLRRLLHRENYDISCFNDPAQALAHCTTRHFDLVLSDQRMPGMLGTELFSKLKDLYPTSKRILISGYSDFSSVTDAFNDGTIDKFVVKPWRNDQLRDLIREQLQLSGQQIDAASHQPERNSAKTVSLPEGSESFHGIVTTDPAMLAQIAMIKKTAHSDAPFFIHGETGTGKELAARAIHLQSNRHERPFVALNCANLTETLLESQLFGHRKGAFTGADKDQTGLFAEADGGSLFLDEVTEIPLGLQAKLLRVLQEREYTPLGETKPIKFDTKIISASSTSLDKAVQSGKFREDLRYRLEILPVTLPPLRQRGGDKKALFDYFLGAQLQRHGLHMIPVDKAVYSCIAQYHWPGNVREMVNVCTYIAAMAGDQSESISVEQLPPVIQGMAGYAAENDPVEPPATKVETTATLASRQITREALEQAMATYAGHRDSMAKHFGISRMTLWRKMKQFDLS